MFLRTARTSPMLSEGTNLAMSPRICSNRLGKGQQGYRSCKGYQEGKKRQNKIVRQPRRQLARMLSLQVCVGCLNCLLESSSPEHVYLPLSAGRTNGRWEQESTASQTSAHIPCLSGFPLLAEEPPNAADGISRFLSRYRPSSSAFSTT